MGLEQGQKLERITSIKNLMKKMAIPLDKAMDLLDLSSIEKEEWKNIFKLKKWGSIEPHLNYLINLKCWPGLMKSNKPKSSSFTLPIKFLSPSFGISVKTTSNSPR